MMGIRHSLALFAGGALRLLLLIQVCSCGNEDALVCDPGSYMDCPCQIGETGQKICLHDGNGWGECACPCDQACGAGELCIYDYCSVDGQPDLYSVCSGTPFTPVCADLSCVEGEEVQYFDLFTNELLKFLRNDTQYMEDHVFINEVEIRPHSDNRIFRVDYLFIYNWIRIRENAQVRRLDPFSEESFREQITTSGFGIMLKRKYTTPVEFGDVVAAIESCGGVLSEVDWCHRLRFDKVSGDLIMTGHIGTINFNANECICITMDLEDGVYKCEDCVCWMT